MHAFAKSAARVLSSLLLLHRAARVSCGLIVRHARLTTRRVTSYRVRLCRSWCSCSFVIPPNVRLEPRATVT